MPQRAHREPELIDDVLECLREPIVVTDLAGTILRASRSARLRLGGGRIEGKRLVAYVDPGSVIDFDDLLHVRRPTAIVPARLVPRADAGADALLTLYRRGSHVVWRIDEPAVQREPLGALATMIENLSDAVLAFDPTLLVTTANRAARRLFGIAAGDRLPDDWHGFGLSSFALGLFAAEAVHAEAHVQHGERAYALTGLPSAGKLIALMLAVDTTARTLQERLEHEFVTNAAHELQTPLAAVAALVEALSGGTVADPELERRFLDHLRRETDRAIRLVDALLLLARAGGGPPALEPVELAPLLEGLAAGLTPAPGIDVQVDVPSGLVVRTHHGLLEAIVANLAQNAIRHTEAGRVSVSARRGSGGVVIEVRDTGEGMDTATRARASDRFYKRAVGSDGFGLGLSIAAQAAAALDAELELESWEGVGTVARVVLPHEPGR